MNFVVVGVGYTGKRVLARLPADNASGINRSSVAGLDRPVVAIDLDSHVDQPLSLTEKYRLLYTVAPAADSTDDLRLARLLELLHPRPERIVYISTSGVYGDCNGRLVNEGDPTGSTTDRANRRLAAEEMLQSWCSKIVCELFILRVPGIYGPGRLGIERIRAAEAIIAESEANPGNRIHVDDLAGCCIAAMTNNAPPGIYNVSDGDFRSSSWFALTVAKLARLASPPQVSREDAQRTFSEARLSFIGESRRLDNRRMLAELKPRLRYTDAEDGIRASLE